MTPTEAIEQPRRELLDADGENRAVRSFLMQYGLPGLTVGAMRQHMDCSGWDAEYCPSFVSDSAAASGEHLTKAGAQIWIRHLFGLEGRAAPAPASEPVADEFGQKVTSLIAEIRKATSMARRDSLVENLIELIDPSPDAAPALPVAPEPAQQSAHAEDAKEIATNVAGEVLHHIDTMYPGMWAPVAKTARLSIRNTIISYTRRFASMLDKGNAVYAARYRYIEENCSTQGGGKGFTITCFVPVDSEDMGCGIDVAVAAELASTAGKDAP